MLDQAERCNKDDKFSKCIQAIEAIPEGERVDLLPGLQQFGRTGGNSVHGYDGEADSALIWHAMELLETIWPHEAHVWDMPA